MWIPPRLLIVSLLVTLSLPTVSGQHKFSGLTIAEKELEPVKLPFTIPVAMPGVVVPIAAAEHEHPNTAEPHE
jgi:hypothetical protein